MFLVPGVDPYTRQTFESLEGAMAKTTKIGRSAKSGRFIKVKTARKRPNTTVVETIKRRGKKRGR